MGQRSKNDRLKLDKHTLTWYTTNITPKHGEQMICLTNVETDETKTMTIDEFKEWFNDDCTGYISSTWSILWVQYDHPQTNPWHGDSMAKQLQPTSIPIGSLWVSNITPDAIKVVVAHIEKNRWLCVEYIRLDTNTKEFEPRNQFQHHNKRL